MKNNEINKIIENAFLYDKSAISKLLSIFENQSATMKNKKREIFNIIRNHYKGFAYIVGICGQPGAGKSTLIAHIIQKFLQKDEKLRIATIAIDPTSSKSHGSILGDRTRINFQKESNRTFFRSQATKLEYGGLSPITFEAIRILGFLYDIIIIETVGIGQNEIDISILSDNTALLISIDHGDQIQFIKSGIMEIPDCFIVHKADDMKRAQKTYYQLKSTLEFLNYFPNDSKQNIPIFLTSATQKTGLDKTVEYFYLSFRNFIFSWDNFFDKQMYFFTKSLKKQYGKWGFDILTKENIYQHKNLFLEDIEKKANEIIKKYIR